jgi:hypothetical protein
MMNYCEISMNVFVSALPGILIKTTFVWMCPLSRQVMIKPQCKIFLVQLSPLSEIHISHKFLTGRITNDQVLNSWRQESQQFQFKFACEWDMQPASAHYSISI